MTLVALDMNATRVRVLHGLSPREGRPLSLVGTDADLPMALSVEGAQPQIGRAGASLCRRSPHLACTDFLARLGDQHHWSGPRCKIDSCGALTAILEHIVSRVPRHTAAVVALPGYLEPERRAHLEHVAELASLRLHGSLDAALAGALTAHAQQAWDGAALYLDIDEHALTWSTLLAGDGSIRVLHVEPHTALNLRLWKERVLAVAADACIRRSRRDPRDSPDAEQMLYDQIDALLLACLERRAGELNVKGPNWSHSFPLTAPELATACRQLSERTLDAFHNCAEAAAHYGPLRTVLVSAEASRLPGLVPSLETELTAFAAPLGSDDPGEDLLDEAPLCVRILGRDAVAGAAMFLANQFQRGLLAAGHLEDAPVLEPQSPTIGAARLHFRGRDHQMRSTIFLLGRDPRCDLVFDTGEHPSVSGQHCKIVYEQQSFTLYDLSRHGTLVNDRPVIQQRDLQAGDWIRLGPGGPLLRFLGQTIDNRKLMPTA